LKWLWAQCKREGFLQKIKEEDGEGCNVYGHLEVNKVAGNFHFAPGNSFQQLNMFFFDFLEFQVDSFNVLPDPFSVCVLGQFEEPNRYDELKELVVANHGRLLV
jgi:hypothetical protein